MVTENPTFRRYSPPDRPACVEVFSSNVPRYFLDHELPDFELFIDSSGHPYFVLELAKTIVGCGGYGIPEGGDTADLGIR